MLVKQIEKVEPVFATVERLDKNCKAIGGYKGRLIDFIVCKSENFTPCVDIVGKSKLMAVIVDSLDTAKKIIQVNQELKGGVINIYPLETIAELKKPKVHLEASYNGIAIKPMLDLIELASGADIRL